MRSIHTNCRTVPAILTLTLITALLCVVAAHARDYDTAVTVAVGEQFTLQETETIGGALIVTGGDATVLGRVKRDVIVVDGSVTLGATARVDGSVLTVRGTVERNELAQVHGEQRQLSAAEFAEIMSGTTLADSHAGTAPEGTEEQAPAEDIPTSDEAPVEQEAEAEATGAEAEADDGETAPEDDSVEPSGAAATQTVREDRAGFGEEIVIPADQTRIGDVASFGGPITIHGTVRGDVASFAGPVTVHGTVDGDIATFGGGVTLSSGSRVTGEIATFGGALSKDPGATHEGKVATFGEGLSRWVGADQQHRQESGWVGGLIVALLVGLLVAAVFPNSTRTVADGIVEQPGRAAGHGALTLLLIVPVCVILALTCVGLILVPLVILGCLGAGILGAVAVEAVVGRSVSRRMGWSVTSLLGLVAIGVITLQFIGLTQFVPALAIVNALVALSVLLFGLGGAIMTGFGTVPDGTWIMRRFESQAPSRSTSGSGPDSVPPTGIPEPETDTATEDMPAASDADDWAPPEAGPSEAEDDQPETNPDDF